MSTIRRFVKRMGSSVYNFGRRAAYGSLRRLLRPLRPAIRWLLRWQWLKRLGLALVGSESPFTSRVRRFLHGGAPLSASSPCFEDALTHGAMQVLTEIRIMRHQDLESMAERKLGRD